MGEFNWGDAYAAQQQALAGSDVLPQAEYEVAVASVKAVVTQKGKQALRLSLRVTSGAYEGQTLADQLTWSPESTDAVRIFSQSLQVLGADPKRVQSENPTTEELAAWILGAECVVQVTHREWQGQMRNNVRYVRPLAMASSGVGAGSAVPTLGAGSGPDAHTSAPGTGAAVGGSEPPGWDLG